MSIVFKSVSDVIEEKIKAVEKEIELSNDIREIESLYIARNYLKISLENIEQAIHHIKLAE